MGSETESVLDVERRRRVALVAVDMAELDDLFAEDLVHVHSNGMVHDKATLMQHILTRRAFRAIHRGTLDVRIYGDVAVLTGAMRNNMEAGGKPVALEGYVTQVLRREPGGWKFVSFQFTLGG